MNGGSLERSERRPSRREFLKGSSRLAAGSALAGATLSVARAAHALGSDVIGVGLVGCGRCGTKVVIEALGTDPGARLVALGDAFDKPLKACVSQIHSRTPGQVDVPADRQFVGLDAYVKVMEQDIKVVIFAAPPRFHPIFLDAATEAGKDVYVEAPVAVDSPGVRTVMESAKRAEAKGLVLAAGFQRRHESRYRETIGRLQEGIIGRVLFARAYRATGPMLARRRMPDQGEMEYQVSNWRNFTWLSGDQITLEHAHNLDVVNWLKESHPVSAEGLGGRAARFDKDAGDVFDHHGVEFTYQDGTKILSFCHQMPRCWTRKAEYAHGTEGFAEISAGKVATLEGQEIWSYRGEQENPIRKHLEAVFRAIRAGERLSEGYDAAQSTLTAIMGRAATYSGQPVTWDQALASELSLGPREFAWSSEPPVVPAASGEYAVAIPGIYKAL
jgi:myo-inositol 2-dehydrogenase/D-chiro-inositol 1-dehydrogenase